MSTKKLKMSKEKGSLYIENFSDIVLQFIESAERFKEITPHAKNGCPFREHSVIRLQGHRGAGHTTAALRVGLKLASEGSKVLIVSGSFDMVQRMRRLLPEDFRSKKDITGTLEFLTTDQVVSPNKLRAHRLNYVFVTDVFLPHNDELRLIENLIPTLWEDLDKVPGTLVFL